AGGPMSNRLGGIGALVLVAVAATAGPALAGRCTTSLISGGLKSQCPSVNDAGLPQCPPGWTKVIYRLDKPFPLDGTVSSAQMASTPTSPCGGAGPTVGLTADSYVIGCWSPEDRRGCRKMKVLNNGTMCLHLAAAPLGCGGASCAALSTEQVVISNAGAAERRRAVPSVGGRAVLDDGPRQQRGPQQRVHRPVAGDLPRLRPGKEPRQSPARGLRLGDRGIQAGRGGRSSAVRRPRGLPRIGQKRALDDHPR